MWYNVNMQFVSTVTQKGQATIPAPIRKRLGIKPNGKVSFEINNKNELVIKPVKDFLELRGSLKTHIKATPKQIREAFGEYLAKEAVIGLK